MKSAQKNDEKERRGKDARNSKGRFPKITI